MDKSSKQVKVFISSTFRDMHAERDHLVTVVFPELRERLERLDLEFYDVDLRWGVPEKGVDGETANSWAYCKQWIDRVKPFFVCILGERYGWVPPAEQILDLQDRAAYRDMSITEMEIRDAVLNNPSRRRSYFYLRQTRVPTNTPSDIYQEFVDVNDQPKLDALKARVRESKVGCPVREYDAHWTGAGFDQVDAFGKMVLEDLWSGVLRDTRYVSKEVWQEVLSKNPDDDALYIDNSQPIPQDIWGKIIERAKPPKAEWLDAEREQMAAFAETRVRWFQGRTNELAQLRAFVNDDLPADANRLCVVKAVAGQGKSALLAKFSQELANSNHFVITHFVGATERSADARSLLERVLKELDRSGIAWSKGEDDKQDLESLRKRLATRFENYSSERKIVFILDGVNQLTDGHTLNWLPHRLGSSIRIILICIDDPSSAPDSREAQVMTALRARKHEPRWVNLRPLDENDVRQVAQEYLVEYCKELDTAQIETICQMEQAKNPLYLLVMLNELRTLGGNDMNKKVPELIAEMKAKYPDTVKLFDWVLERLEVFGQEEVRLWCTYLSLGRVGMASRELSDLLARRLGKEAGRRALLIERGIRRYLQRRGEQLDLFHGQLREAVTRRYLQEDVAVFHADVAEYMETRWREPNTHTLSELPYHQAKSGQSEKFQNTLSDIWFLQTKLNCLGVQSLIEDYDLVELASISLSDDSRTGLGLIQSAIRLSAHVLENDKSQLVSHLMARLFPSREIELGTFLEQLNNSKTEPWFKLLMPSFLQAGNPLEFTLTGHARAVQGIAITPDGRYIVSGCSGNLRWWDLQNRSIIGSWNVEASFDSLAVTPDGQFALFATGELVRIWDLVSGAELGVLRGHQDKVNVVAIAPNGEFAVSGSEDNTCIVWDLKTFEAKGTLFGHEKSVTALAITPDNNRVLSGSWDHKIRVWDIVQLKPLAVLSGHWHKVVAVVVAADGKTVASLSQDKTVKVWDLDRFVMKSNLSLNAMDAGSLAITPDGRRIVFDEANMLVVWDIEHDREVTRLRGHSAAAYVVVISSDGGYAVSGSEDRTVRVWNLNAVREQIIFPHHNEFVNALAIGPDGRTGVSCSDDRTIKIWNIKTLAVQHTFTGHKGWVSAVAITPSGEYALSCSRGGQFIFTGVLVTNGSGSGNLSSDAWSENSLKLWNLNSFVETKELTAEYRDFLNAVVITPDGHYAFVASSDKTIKVWDLETRTQVARLKGHNDQIFGLALTPDGKRLVSGSSDGFEKIWDVDRLVEIVSKKVHEGTIEALTISPDGRFVVSASNDKTLKVWDLSNDNFTTLRGHTDRVTSVIITPDARLAFSGSDDRTVKIWDLHTQDILTSLDVDARTKALAVTPDGEIFIAGDEPGNVHFLELKNVTLGMPIVSCWHSPTTTKSLTMSGQGSRLAFRCVHCGEWSEASERTLGNEASCRACNKLVKLNSFVIEEDWKKLSEKTH